MKLTKVKRPGGLFTFEVLGLTSDEYGEWLFAPNGSAWEAPHDSGRLSWDVMILLSPRQWAVTWWVDDPTDRSVGIDVCLPPEQVKDGWRFVDLELDPVRHEDGTVEIEDRDEFQTACDDGWISRADADVALATAITMEGKLRIREEPWGEEGWRRLDLARGRSS